MTVMVGCKELYKMFFREWNGKRLGETKILKGDMLVKEVGAIKSGGVVAL